MMKLERYEGNPILSPHPDHPWEDLAVFNPAAWYDEERKEVLLLYRAAESFVSTVNSGAAYVVNDVYRRYLDPQAPPRQLVALGYAASVAVILLGIAFGFLTDHVHSITRWIVSGLVPAFVVPNVLKWHWWRFNSWGFFAGMVAGTAASLALPTLVPGLHEVAQFMSILGASAVISVVVCLVTPPDDLAVLEQFYRTVRPWGFWGPVHRRLLAEHPALEKNRDFGRDVLNLAVSLVWQTAMVALPIYVVIQHWSKAAACLAVFVVTSAILKFTWYDRLGPGEMYLEEPSTPPSV